MALAIMDCAPRLKYDPVLFTLSTGALIQVTSDDQARRVTAPKKAAALSYRRSLSRSSHANMHMIVMTGPVARKPLANGDGIVEQDQGIGISMVDESKKIHGSVAIIVG